MVRFSSYLAELEPFEGGLAQRIQDLSAQVEEHTLHLANLRRSAPQDSAQRFARTFEKHSLALDSRLSAGEDVQMQAANSTKMEIPPMERVGETHRTWQKGTEDLSGLKTNLGGTVARLERAQKAMEVIDEK